MSALREMVKNKRQNLAAQMGRREKTMRVPPGKSRWRILPSWEGKPDGIFSHPFSQHFVKDVAGELKAVHVCLDKTFGLPCNICTTLEQALRVAPSDDIINALGESKSKSKELVNAIRIDGDNPGEQGILELSPTTFDQWLSVWETYDAEEEPIDILDLKNGFDVIIERTGKGLNTEYKVNAAPRPSAVANASEVMKKLIDLASYAHQEAAEVEQKAIGVVKAVAGALPAPVATGGKPSATSKPKAAGLDGSSADEAIEGEFENLGGIDDDTTGAEWEAATPSKKPVDPAESAEIDDILAELEGL